VASRVVPAGGNDQGLTTVMIDGRIRTVARGAASVPEAYEAAGWSHVGSPAGFGAEILDAYQGSPRRAAKLFTLTTPDGRRYRYLHRLVPGEKFNNSFAAVAPGAHWFVSGEWGTMSRLLVFPVPRPAGSSAVTRPLSLAATITLAHPVRNVQGCAFDGSTTLVCSTNDPRTDLYAVPRQLLSVRLAQPLDGRSETAVPRLLGAVPSQTVCPGHGEVEGIDVVGNRMRVAVNARCAPVTQVFTLLHSAQVTRPRQ
jgi:hypothetical protein